MTPAAPDLARRIADAFEAEQIPYDSLNPRRNVPKITVVRCPRATVVYLRRSISTSISWRG